MLGRLVEALRASPQTVALSHAQYLSCGCSAADIEQIAASAGYQAAQLARQPAP